jgi:hypothetical protein
MLVNIDKIKHDLRFEIRVLFKDKEEELYYSPRKQLSDALAGISSILSCKDVIGIEVKTMTLCQ